MTISLLKKMSKVGALVSAAVTCLMTAAPASALLPQSWNGYKWSRTGPLAIKLVNNTSAIWSSYFDTAQTQWSADPIIDFVPVAGTSGLSTCNPIFGSVQVCSGSYGFNGWLGYANVWSSGGFIVQATVRLNDSYFANARYNTAAWRSMTVCQEIGHTLGLDHTNTVRTNANTGSCMDYSNDPAGTAGGGNGTLANIAPNAVDFAALAGIYSTVNTTQLTQTKPTYLAGHGFSISGEEIEFGHSLVPEPGTWSMMIAGFGLVGAIQRRRHNIVTVVTA